MYSPIKEADSEPKLSLRFEKHDDLTAIAIHFQQSPVLTSLPVHALDPGEDALPGE
jgi:hypothetical protein